MTIRDPTTAVIGFKRITGLKCHRARVRVKVAARWVFVHRNGKTERVTSIDRVWLNQASGAIVWVDLAAPSVPESLILSETFGFAIPVVLRTVSELEGRPGTRIVRVRPVTDPSGKRGAFA